MKFRIDIRYTAVQSLKAIAGYLIGILLVFNFLNIKEPSAFVSGSLFAAIALFFILIYPRNILVRDEKISFVKENDILRREVELADIIKISTSSKLYNTLILITKSGKRYKLHPQDAQALESIILSHKQR